MAGHVWSEKEKGQWAFCSPLSSFGKQKWRLFSVKRKRTLPHAHHFDRQLLLPLQQGDCLGPEQGGVLRNHLGRRRTGGLILPIIHTDCQGRWPGQHPIQESSQDGATKPSSYRESISRKKGLRRVSSTWDGPVWRAVGPCVWCPRRLPARRPHTSPAAAPGDTRAGCTHPQTEGIAHMKLSAIRDVAIAFHTSRRRENMCARKMYVQVPVDGVKGGVLAAPLPPVLRVLHRVERVAARPLHHIRL